MRFFMHKNKLACAALVMGFGFSVHAVAHEQAGALTATGGTANTTTGATDYYTVNCFSDPNTSGGAIPSYLYFQILDTTDDGNLVGMTVINSNGAANAKAATTVDGSGADSTYSQAQKIVAGSGVYTVAVWHTGAAIAQNYSFTFHCQDVSANHTGTTITRVSNQ